MAKRVFIIHGWDGNPEDSWKTWLKNELEKRKFEVIAPQMPGGNNPIVKEWLKVLANIVNEPKKDDYFVGHSLGCISICRYLETLPKEKIVGGCIFVSGFCSDLNIPELTEFTNLPLDFSKVKSRAKNFVLIHSDDDEDVPIEKGIEFKEKLGAKLIIEKEMGHISEGDNIKKLPSLLKSIMEMQDD